MKTLNRPQFTPFSFGTSVIAVLVLVLAGCASSNGSGDIELPSAEESLSNARAAIADVSQFEFELTHPEGTTSLDGGLDLRRAGGAVISPGRLKVNAEADLGRIFVKIDAVVIDGDTWMTNPLTSNWAEIAPEDSPFSFLDPVQLVTNVLAQTSDPAYPEDGGVQGGLIALNGKIPSEALQPLVGTVLPGEVLDVSMRLEADTFIIRSARLMGRLQPGDESNYVRLITLSGFDSELVIEPPI